MQMSLKEKVVARRVLRALRDLVSAQADLVAVIEKAAADWGIVMDPPRSLAEAEQKHLQAPQGRLKRRMLGN